MSYNDGYLSTQPVLGVVHSRENGCPWTRTITFGAVSIILPECTYIHTPKMYTIVKDLYAHTCKLHLHSLSNRVNSSERDSVLFARSRTNSSVLFVRDRANSNCQILITTIQVNFCAAWSWQKIHLNCRY